MEQATNRGGQLRFRQRSGGQRSGGAATIVRGVLRLFRSLDCAALPEIALGNGRRADIVAVDRRGQLTIVEVKSSPEDYRADHKWPEYLAFCDYFAFAVGTDFPLHMLPAEPGVIIADRHGAAIVRAAPPRTGLPTARRRALTLTFARTAASRLAVIVDPWTPDTR